jgi:hypothetical protein
MLATMATATRSEMQNGGSAHYKYRHARLRDIPSEAAPLQISGLIMQEPSVLSSYHLG